MNLNDITGFRTLFGQRFRDEFESMESPAHFPIEKQQPQGDKTMSIKDRMEKGQQWTDTDQRMSWKITGMGEDHFHARVGSNPEVSITYERAADWTLTHYADGSAVCLYCTEKNKDHCNDRDEGWWCTRHKDHGEDHVACCGPAGKHFLHRWPQVKPKSWPERIAEAREEGSFTSEDKDLAGNWPDCGCGEQDDRIPRMGENDGGICGAPLDQKLYRIGMFFDKAVHRDDVDMAAHFLEEIEARAAKIIAEIEVAKTVKQ